MNNKLKNIIIGVFITIAIALAISSIVFLKPSIGDGGKTYNVRFSDVSGINVGTLVTLAGRPVGEVKKIEQITDARKEKVDKLGRVYFYQLTLKVDSSIQIYNSDEINIQTIGLLGEKSIAIMPKAIKKGEKPKPITTQIIYANSISALENALYLISNLASHIKIAVDDFNQWFVENSDELSIAIQSFSKALKAITNTFNDINNNDVIIDIKETINGFKYNMYLIKEMLQEINDTDTISNGINFIDNISQFSNSLNKDGSQILQNINSISENINNNKGTIGKLINTDDIYLEVGAILSKVNTLMNDINHYGLLFQYNKTWQRGRTKRATILNALKTPSEFKNYFQNEVDNITTSLSRLSILLNKAEEEHMMDEDSFKKSFYDFMQQVDSLSNSIKYYNEEMMDKEN